MKLLTSTIVRKRLAKLMVRDTVRNTILEEYHSTATPIGDKEMKKFIKEVVDNVYTFLTIIRQEDEHTELLRKTLAKTDLLPYWDEPKFISLSKKL